MTSLEIKTYPDPIVRNRCEGVTEINNEVLELIDGMEKKMVKAEGIGLAANQVGIGKKIIIVLSEKGPEAFLNPKILKKSREAEVAQEGCLSLPGIRLEIKRAKEIVVQAQDAERRILRVEAKGLVARIFQHEIDHIDGKLIIDRIGFWEKFKIRKQLKAIVAK